MAANNEILFQIMRFLNVIVGCRYCYIVPAMATAIVTMAFGLAVCSATCAMDDNDELPRSNKRLCIAGSSLKDLRIMTWSSGGMPLNNKVNQEISPDTVASSVLFPELSSPTIVGAPAASDYACHMFLLGFQTTIDQHSEMVMQEDLEKKYCKSVRMLDGFPPEKQLIAARFCLSFSDCTEMHDAALAELMNVLRPEILLGQSADRCIEKMMFQKNKEACCALKDSVRRCTTHVSAEELYEIYELAPALFYDHRAFVEKMNIIDGLIHPHPHFESLSSWGQTETITQYLKSLPTLMEYKNMARDFQCLANYAISNMNKAMISNWLIEHKGTPKLRSAIVEQTASLMNQPDFKNKKLSIESGAALAIRKMQRDSGYLDEVVLDPKCRPTDILEAIHQITARRNNLTDEEKIALQWEAINSVTGITGLSDSAIARAINAYPVS